MWKRYSNYEGGTADPMIVSWPARSRRPGVRSQYTHAIDIVPTIYECLGIEPPEVLKGYTQFPIEGVSFASTFNDAEAKTGKTTQFYSMGGTRAIWHDGWKAADLVAGGTRRVGRVRAASGGSCSTPSTTRASATTSPSEHPEKLQELIALWWTAGREVPRAATRDRGALEILGTERPQIAKPRNRYVYYPGCAEVPESVAPNIRNRSYTIAVEVDIDSAEAGGVLFATAPDSAATPSTSRTASSSTSTTSSASSSRSSRRPSRCRPATHVFSASFEREGDTMPAEGTLTLHIGDDKVGEGKIKTQPGKFSLAGEGLNIGKDSAEPVTDDYPGDVTVALHRWHDPAGRRRRQRRALRRPGEGCYRRVRT